MGALRIALLGLALLLALPAADAEAQGRRGRRGFGELPENVPYDGRFTFARIRYAEPGGGLQGFGREPPWAHDYPRAERHFMQILAELTTVEPRMEESNIFTLDDPELFKYPVAYLSEPGFWLPSPSEIEGLRNYLLKGGFLIVDDFVNDQWYNFEVQMRKVLPEHRFVPLTPAHAIFDSFYRIETLDYVHPLFGAPSQFLGVFEDNDPARRMLVIVNYNNDIGEYWEYSGTGFFPIDLSNTAYKLGVNYLVYAFTR